MMRPWCAKMQWNGKQAFILGTISMRIDAPMHEVEAEIWALWDRVMPQEHGRPKLLNLMPGALVFHSEETEGR